MPLRVGLQILEAQIQPAVGRVMSKGTLGLFGKQLPERPEIAQRQPVVGQPFGAHHQAGQHPQPQIDVVPLGVAQPPPQIQPQPPAGQQRRRQAAEQMMAAHRQGRFPPVAIDMDDPGVGESLQQLAAKNQRPAGAFHPNAGAPQPLLQPLEQIAEMLRRGLRRLAQHHRLQFVIQRLVIIGQMRQRNQRQRRHGLPVETGGGVVHRINQFREIALQRQAHPGIVLAV